jgi:hypothetical protein
MSRFKLRADELVEVRDKAEILSTLDENGRLEDLPFMPQMFQYCGKRYRVYKSAHKTCDTVFPVRGRKLADAVHLDIRCDGKAYGGCQAGCLIFWKTAWLKRVGDDDGQKSVTFGGCTEKNVWDGRIREGKENTNTVAYSCQATQLPYFTSELNPWDIRQYIEDYRSGNVGIWRLINGFIYSNYYRLSRAGIGLGPILKWLYDTFHPFWRGTAWPRTKGEIANGQPTPKLDQPLNLQPGELVRIKSHQEILRTLNVENKNQGLYFDAEMVPFCGRTFRVLQRVDKILDEKTGRMVTMKTPSIILQGAVCESRYSYCRMFCPRAIYSYWREIWLERVERELNTKQSPLVQTDANKSEELLVK